VPYLDNVVYTPHAIEQMDERLITSDMVEAALANGEVIEEYETSEESRYLILGEVIYRRGAPGRVRRGPLHVVAADQAHGRTLVVTAHDPREGPGNWSDDFRTRLPEDNG
jgi:hypothetical protein